MAILKLKTKSGKIFQLNESDEIHRGGEGRIIAIKGNTKKVAKIYHSGIKPICESKFDYLKQLDKNIFISPDELLYDDKNLVVGFIMDYLDQSFVPLASVFNKNYCRKNNIDDNFKTKIINKLIEALKTAHAQKILIGDFNQYNILINLSGELKLIDTDSFETQGCKHTNTLLEDIRDYLYGGTVNENSDFFALSVLVFYMLSHTHPFKGIHKKYKSLSERMIQKIPVFKKDPDLVVPKCYTPLQDKNLIAQFESFYIGGNRFLISLAAIKGKITKTTKPKIKIIDQKDVYISTLLENLNIRNVKCSFKHGIVETDTNLMYYSFDKKGTVNIIDNFSKTDYQQAFLGEKNLLLKKNRNLYLYQYNKKNIEIGNFEFNKDVLISQFENILVLIDNNLMTYLYLDDIMNDSIKVKKDQVFSQGFRLINGLIQNTGGVERIFYHTGKDLANVKTGIISKDIVQKKNIGIIQYLEKGKVVNKYYKINNLDFELTNIKLSDLLSFAYIKQDRKHGFVFEPSDNIINIRRIEDFNIISELKCDYISSDSQLYYTQSGIVALEENSLYLINKK